MLRRGERFTRTDNVYLAKGGTLLTLASLAASLSSLLLALLFARLVTKDAYGSYQYLLAWGSILAIFSVTGISDALTRAVAQGHDGTIMAALRTRLRGALIGAWHFGAFPDTLVLVAVGALFVGLGAWSFSRIQL